MTTCVNAVFGLAIRAAVVATPAMARVNSVLERYERSGKAIHVTPPKPPSPTHMDALRRHVKSVQAEMDAVAVEMGVLTTRLNELVISRRKRQAFPWLRWRPDRVAEASIAMLREDRARLQARSDRLAQARLRATIKEREARNELVRSEAVAARAWTAASATATRTMERRVAVLARARMLLMRLPSLAYVGARRLLAMATRVESAREQGYDPGSTITPS